MRKILCGVCFVVLLTGNVWAQNVDSTEVQVLAETSESWDGEDLPSYPKGEPKITILRIKIPPNEKLEFHKHPVINAGVLLKGELTVVTKDGQKLHLSPGDPIVEVVEKWHYGKTGGSETAEVIVFYAGTKDLPTTVPK